MIANNTTKSGDNAEHEQQSEIVTLYAYGPRRNSLLRLELLVSENKIPWLVQKPQKVEGGKEVRKAIRIIQSQQKHVTRHLKRMAIEQEALNH